MKKSKIRQWGERSAEHVVMHGKWQKSRGRKPSVSFQGLNIESNPRKALLLAASTVILRYAKIPLYLNDAQWEVLCEAVKYVNSVRMDILAGTDIKNAALTMIYTSLHWNGKIVKVNFNGVELITTKNNVNVAKIVEYYRDESKRQGEARRNSLEEKKATKEFEKKIANAQKRTDNLIEKLPSIDFSNYEVLPDWLCEFEKHGGWIKVTKDTPLVIKTLKAKGFESDANTGKDSNKEDMKNVAIHLIGQCLACLEKSGAIYQRLPNQVADWKEKFLPKEKVMMKHGEWISNAHDPRLTNARKIHDLGWKPFDKSKEELDQLWKEDLEWINKNVIGEPVAILHFTAKTLKAEGIVGIYAPMPKVINEQPSNTSSI